MTPNEYLNKISKEIRECLTDKQAIEVVEKAERVLDNSNISESSKKQFWVDLYEELGGESSWVCESQDSAALSAIINAAKAIIALKAKK